MFGHHRLPDALVQPVLVLVLCTAYKYMYKHHGFMIPETEFSHYFMH